MSIKRLVLTLALTAFAVPSVSIAQQGHQATVLLRNGDRVAGTLEDVEGGTVYVRVSLHDQRKLPVGDVALIDFVGGASGLPDTELNVARGADHVAFLRGGESLTGRFVDIHGGEKEPKENFELIFRTTSGEERRFPLDRVGRIYLGNFPSTTTASSAANSALPSGAIRVPGNAMWTATPLTVRKGDRVTFNVSGQVQLSEDAGDVAQAAGSLKQRRATGAPLPQNFAGALIARVGNSAPFPIGDQKSVTMPADGQLYLGINDDEVSDNRGEFVVQLSRSR
jgi:hypothetical protein